MAPEPLPSPVPAPDTGAEAGPGATPQSAPIPADRMRRMVRTAVVVPLLLTGGLCALLLWDVGVLHAQSRRVERSRQVIGQVNLAQKLLVDQETGLRAYLPTGDPRFLEPYESSQAALPGVLDALANVVTDDSAQRARVEDLRVQVAEWSRYAGDVKARMDRDQSWKLPADASRVKEMLLGKSEMDGMRRVTDAMVAGEERLLAEHTTKAARSVAATEWAGAVLALIFGVVVAVSSVVPLSSLDRAYRLALRRREESEASERQARHAAEALAAEIAEQSREIERKFITMRDERDAALAQAGKPGRG
jgi:CHASE3 domain sensor protein